MKKVSNLFWILSALLANVMCAVVAYDFCDMQWGIRYAGYSAPVWVAFLPGIPYLVGICVCILAALHLRRKGR